MEFGSVERIEQKMLANFTPEQRLQAHIVVEDLSVMACMYSGHNWTENTVPQWVAVIVEQAAERHLRNPDAFRKSDAGDESVDLAGVRKASANFDRDEIDRLTSVRLGGGMNVSPAILYSTRSATEQRLNLAWISPEAEPIKGFP